MTLSLPPCPPPRELGKLEGDLLEFQESFSFLRCLIIGALQSESLIKGESDKGPEKPKYREP